MCRESTFSTDRSSTIIRKIVSGGQTGADRAGLDAAIDNGVVHGGWCPAGRFAEDGVIPARYRLTETDSALYIVRTQYNVTISDATVVFTEGRPLGGSQATLDLARSANRPCLHIDLAAIANNEDAVRKLSNWLDTNTVLNHPELPCLMFGEHGLTLNVAGSRESSAPGIYGQVYRIISDLLKQRGQSGG